MRRYEISVVCDNCGKPDKLFIKKGITVLEAIKAKELICNNCGNIIQPKEYKTQWLK